jgi:hypothetical protein
MVISMDDYDRQREYFFKLCKKRHYMGEFKYGDSWKKDDKNWSKEVLEELADAVNYLSYLAVKIQKGDKNGKP